MKVTLLIMCLKQIKSEKDFFPQNLYKFNLRTNTKYLIEFIKTVMISYIKLYSENQQFYQTIHLSKEVQIRNHFMNRETKSKILLHRLKLKILEGLVLNLQTQLIWRLELESFSTKYHQIIMLFSLVPIISKTSKKKENKRKVNRLMNFYPIKSLSAWTKTE